MKQASGLDDRPAALRLWDRRDVFKPFAIAGSLGVIAGGLLASVIAAPAPTRHGTWATAYLVLVLGVGQLALGAGRTLLSTRPQTPRGAAVATALFNVAGLAILGGVVFGHTAVFDVGAALLFGTLVLFLYETRGANWPSWPLYAYRLLIGVLLVGIPIGTFITAGAN